MAAFDLVANMYDDALKPRLLRKILKEHVPDEKHPFQDPSELSKVVSMVKTYKILSESMSSTNQKLIDSWKSAVDSWVDRLLHLISNNMPDKCWAGICLLGLTCQVCSSDRFLASYNEWFHKLLPHIQSPADSDFVKVASCASISDILKRLGEFQNAKKDGTILAGKIIQPVLKLLNDDSSVAILEGAVHLLCTIVNIFPYSVRRHYEYAEAVVASKILSGKCTVNVSEKLAHCLALLPKSKGDESGWCLLIQKLLLSINDHLNDIFQGLDEDTRSNDVVRLLVPPGQDLPPPLGSSPLSGEASDNILKRSGPVLTSSVSTLMLCCCRMITNSYTTQVTVPVRSLFALCTRVLMVDGSLPRTPLPFMTAMQQESICSELPALHSCTLQLLIALIKGLRSQLLPHAASIVRLITKYFKRCELAELRIKVYSITKLLMISMGVGMAMCLSKEVINNALVDLDPIGNENSYTSNSKTTTEVSPQPSNKKRKYSNAATRSLEEQRDDSALRVEASKKPLNNSVSLWIAALEALEALFNVGELEQRSPNVDHLLITAATNSFKGGWTGEEKFFQPTGDAGIWADFQLAALRALLASILSSAHSWPPYLAQGLKLFNRGKIESGTKLAEFCAHALLALEVLLHPRSRQLSEFTNARLDGPSRKNQEISYAEGLKQTKPYNFGIQHMENGTSKSDYESQSWLANYTETETPVRGSNRNVKVNEELYDALKVPWAEKHFVDGPLDSKTTIEGVEMRDNGDASIIESHQFTESLVNFHEPMSFTGTEVPATTHSETVSERDVSGSGMSDQIGSNIASGKDASMTTKGDGFVSRSMSVSPATSDSEGSEGLMKRYNESPKNSLHENDADFPDIIDGDPDSDSE